MKMGAYIRPQESRGFREISTFFLPKMADVCIHAMMDPFAWPRPRAADRLPRAGLESPSLSDSRSDPLQEIVNQAIAIAITD